MKQEKKFAPSEQQHASDVRSQQNTEREFASVEELLRYDAEQTIVPAEIAQRLQRSTARFSPPAARPWWKRLFGGTNL